MRVERRFAVPLGVAAVAAVIAGCGGGDQKSAGEGTAPTVVETAGITEANLPPGFEPNPTVRVNGKQWRFDKVPGHYWKVLDDSGYAVGLHFQTDKPFRWAQDAKKGELLYLVYAVPGNCGNGNFNQAVKSQTATIEGPVPGGFDHWHGLVGAGPAQGHWLMHTPVRDFRLAGPPGNPMTGTKIVRGIPKFMPVCDIR